MRLGDKKSSRRSSHRHGLHDQSMGVGQYALRIDSTA